MTIVYIAISKADYNTDYEKEIIKKIKVLYPSIKDEDILLPKTVIMNEEDKKKDLLFQEWKYFCSLIDKSDVIIAVKCCNDMSYRGKYTPGVKFEIGYGKRTKKVVIELDKNFEAIKCL